MGIGQIVHCFPEIIVRLPMVLFEWALVSFSCSAPQACCLPRR